MKVTVITGNGNKDYFHREYSSIRKAYKEEISLLRWGINAMGETDAYVKMLWSDSKGNTKTLEVYSFKGRIGGYTKESKFNEFYVGVPKFLWTLPVEETEDEEGR